MTVTVNGYRKYEGFTRWGRFETMAKDIKNAVKNFRGQLMARGIRPFDIGNEDFRPVRLCV